jgi:predicted Zn-dependent peptidase
MIRLIGTTLLCAGLFALGCEKPKPPASPEVASTATAPAPPPEPPALLEPPARGIAPSTPFHPIAHHELTNGLKLRVVERRVHAIAEVQLVVRSGTATDGEKPGLAAITGELLKDGGAGGLSSRKLVERAEALGASLDVRTDRDSTRISLGVTSDDFEAALDILGMVALSPAMAEAELVKLKAREEDRVRSAARGSAAWSASMILYRELYDLPTAVHPYSRYDAQPDEIRKLTLADCRAWHKAHFVPSNASLVVVGDVTAERVQRAATKVFGAWKGDTAPRPSFAAPLPPPSRQIYLVDRPGSAQSQVYVGVLGVERKSNEWPALAAANQVLGGGVSGRLFLDVREKRSLAYGTGSSLGEVAVGPGPMVLSAGTQTPKAAETVGALLEHIEKMATTAPSESELEAAVNYLADSFVFRLETVGSVADLVSQLYVFGLDDDYYDEYRKALRELGLTTVTATAQRRYHATPVIVVAGDAAILGPKLAEFGPVTVLDPEKGFTLKRSYPKK